MHPGHGVGVLDAHLTLQAVGVAEKDAEDGAEIGDELIAGAPGDQPVPDLVERAEGSGVQPEVVDAAPAEHRRLPVGFGVPLDLEDVQFGGRADADEGELDGAVELLQVRADLGIEDLPVERSVSWVKMAT